MPSRTRIANIRWVRPVGEVSAVIGWSKLAEEERRRLEHIFEKHIEQNQGAGAQCGKQSQPLLDEGSDRLAIAAQQPRKEIEARPAGQDRRQDEQPEID